MGRGSFATVEEDQAVVSYKVPLQGTTLSVQRMPETSVASWHSQKGFLSYLPNIRAGKASHPFNNF